jgi:hypothetical protein
MLLTEEQLNKLIEEEVRKYLLEEGILDTAKDVAVGAYEKGKGLVKGTLVGDMAIAIVYPGYKPSIGGISDYLKSIGLDVGKKPLPIGHAAICHISRESGAVTYYEFGRYLKPGQIISRLGGLQSACAIAKAQLPLIIGVSLFLKNKGRIPCSKDLIIKDFFGSQSTKSGKVIATAKFGPDGDLSNYDAILKSIKTYGAQGSVVAVRITNVLPGTKAFLDSTKRTVLPYSLFGRLQVAGAGIGGGLNCSTFVVTALEAGLAGSGFSSLMSLLITEPRSLVVGLANSLGEAASIRKM